MKDGMGFLIGLMLLTGLIFSSVYSNKVIIKDGQNYINDFVLSDNDSNYRGYINSGGYWIIIKYNSTSQRFEQGLENYKEYWNNRTNLTYKYFNDSFN